MVGLQLDLVKLNKERGGKASILNVISDFPRKGALEKGFLKSYKFILPISLLILTAFMLLLFSLNKYLKNYKRKS